jgi:pSer/pThr/pTyr-binding forkhead associated (FHA) protein
VDRGAILAFEIELTVMSGVEDGLHLNYTEANGDGHLTDERWSLSIGRKEDCDVCLRFDNYVSRQHAYLYWENNRWWLQDHDSANGTFIEQSDAIEARVIGTIQITPGQLFRVGHTWLRIEDGEANG